MRQGSKFYRDDVNYKYPLVHRKAYDDEPFALSFLFLLKRKKLQLFEGKYLFLLAKYGSLLILMYLNVYFAFLVLKREFYFL